MLFGALSAPSWLTALGVALLAFAVIASRIPSNCPASGGLRVNSIWRVQRIYYPWLYDWRSSRAAVYRAAGRIAGLDTGAWSSLLVASGITCDADNRSIAILDDDSAGQPVLVGEHGNRHDNPTALRDGQR